MALNRPAMRPRLPPMLKFLIRRLSSVLITLLVITAIIYGIVMLSPAETRARLYMGRRTRTFMPPELEKRTIERIIREHGLNDPFPVQYLRWASRLLQGDWGWSPLLRSDVLDALLVRTPATAELTFYSLLLFIPLGLVSGAVAGWKRDRTADHGFRLVAFIATSIPPFILGLVLMSIFYVGLHWFLPGRLGALEGLVVRSSSFKTFTGLLTIDGLLNGRLDISLSAARHLVLPVVTLSLVHWATLGRVTRASMIEELGKEYIVAAHARGLPRRRILWQHALRNAMVPGLTSSALSAASLVTGIYVVEVVFAWPGVSKLITSSMWQPDTSLAVGFAVYSVVVVLMVMMILDVAQAIADPRIREGGIG
jgi:ABC-type dipeptide/oligopeptide/nickel transport system permease component